MSLATLPWQALIIGSVILSSLSEALNKGQSHRASALQVQSNKYIGSFLTASLWWWLSSGVIPQNWLSYYIYGAFVAMNLVIFTIAQRISMSQTASIRPLGELLGILLAMAVLNEWLLFASYKGWQLLIALILMPLLFLLFFEKENKYSKKWLKFSLIFIVNFAIIKVLAKQFLTIATAGQVLMFQYLGSLSGAIAGAKLRKQKPYFSKKFALRGMAQGCIGSSGIILLYTAMKYSTISQTTLLRTPLLLIVTTSIGLLGFKEIKEMTIKKWTAMGLALVMTILVVTANHS